jgi:hypothetical protein
VSSNDTYTDAFCRVVSIRCISEPPITVNIERWSSNLAHAMTIFFDCQSYNTAFDERVDWSFYGVSCIEYSCRFTYSFSIGLAEQTVTAALAFEMVSMSLTET